MNAGKRKRLRHAGWKTGTVAEFLELNPEESALIEIKLRLSDLVKKVRARRRLSQTALAKRLGSSQSRVAKIEAGTRACRWIFSSARALLPERPEKI